MRSNNEENIQIMKIDYPFNSKGSLESSKINESHETEVALGALNGETLGIMSKTKHYR